MKNAIKQMVLELMKSDISDKMEALREKMLEFWSDNVITAAERRALNVAANNITRELDERYKWAQDIFTDLDESGEGTAGGFATMSQDSADEQNGRFTSIQIATQDIRTQVALGLEQLHTIAMVHTNNNTYLREMRDIQISNNAYLADIAKDTRAITQFGSSIERIARNTDRL